MTRQIPTFATRKLENGMLETYRVFEIPVVKIGTNPPITTIANSKEELKRRKKANVSK